MPASMYTSSHSPHSAALVPGDMRMLARACTRSAPLALSASRRRINCTSSVGHYGWLLSPIHRQARRGAGALQLTNATIEQQLLQQTQPTLEVRVQQHMAPSHIMRPLRCKLRGCSARVLVRFCLASQGMPGHMALDKAFKFRLLRQRTAWTTSVVFEQSTHVDAETAYALVSDLRTRGIVAWHTPLPHPAAPGASP